MQVATAVETGRVTNGDLIIITAGVPTGETGTTNMMKIHLLVTKLLMVKVLDVDQLLVLR